MKKIFTRGGMIVAATMTSLAFLVGNAGAVVSLPRAAQLYSVWFARAYDPCVNPVNDAGGPVVTVVSPTNVPSLGCLSSNVTTDNLMTMNWAKVMVNSRGRLIVFGAGFPFGARVKVQLNLRITRKTGTTKHPPGSNQMVTFQDVSILCPAGAFGFVGRPSGGLVGSMTLAQCLGTSNGLAGVAGSPANIEVIGAQLINVDNGLPLTNPGIVR